MGDDHQSVKLPPGFRFCPTDEELVLHFLYPKAFFLPCSHPNIIPDLDLHLHHPWEFNGTALSSGNMHYFFTRITEDRATSNGYWKELDIMNETIFVSGNKVAVKKYLVFYVFGESPSLATETNWVMEEYNLCNNVGLTSASPAYKRRRKQKQDLKWVLCRVHERKDDISRQSFRYEDDDDGIELSCLDEMFLTSLDDDLEEISMQY